MASHFYTFAFQPPNFRVPPKCEIFRSISRDLCDLINLSHLWCHSFVTARSINVLWRKMLKQWHWSCTFLLIYAPACSLLENTHLFELYSCYSLTVGRNRLKHGVSSHFCILKIFIMCLNHHNDRIRKTFSLTCLVYFGYSPFAQIEKMLSRREPCGLTMRSLLRYNFLHWFALQVENA